MTWRTLLARIETVVSSSDARRIVERASGYEGAELWAHLEEDAPARATSYAEALAERRLGGEPLQYVLGGWGFRRLDLFLDRRVLIPRPETEMVVEWALGELAELRPPRRRNVVDLGTGSGAIALSIAVEASRVSVWATDTSPEALAVARANIAGVGSPAGARVRLMEGDWWDALPPELEGQIDLVVSNPPYVADSEELPSEVADWEPAGALVSGPSGLDDIAVIIDGAPRWLARPGRLVIELAPHQGDSAAAMARAAGFDDVELRRDLTDRVRALVGRV